MATRSYTTRRQSGRRRPPNRISGSAVAAGVGGLLVVVMLVLGAAGAAKKPAGAKNANRGASVTGAPQSQRGAVAAATAFENAYLVVDLKDQAEGRNQILAKTAKSFQTQVSRNLDDLFARVAGNPLLVAQQEGVDHIARTWPVNYRVESYTPQKAVVTIWSCVIAGIRETAVPRISWMRDRLTMTREAGDWKLAGYRELTPLVPNLSQADKPTNDSEFYAAQEGAVFYDAVP